MPAPASRALKRVEPGTMCALALLAACSAAEESAQVPGVLATWRVEEIPELTIGNVDGAEEYLLTNPLYGVLLGDGTVVVQNSVTRSLFELRYFDARGQHLATASRWGQGPFEFDDRASTSRLPGDSVLVVGSYDGRYAVFGPRGERVREGRIPEAAGFNEIERSALDASHVGGQAFLQAAAPGPHRRRDALIVRSLTGATDTIAVLNSERVFFVDRGRFYNGYDAPFTPRAFSAPGPGVFWFGSTDVPEVYGYRLNEHRTDTIRLGWSATPVTGTERERWSDSVSSSLNSSRMRGAEELGFPDSFPYWGALEVDRAGNVWVLRYEAPWPEGPQRWSVYSPLGEPVAEVTLPRAIAPDCEFGCRFGLLDIGVDHVLLARRGELGVAQVHLHRLVKE